MRFAVSLVVGATFLVVLGCGPTMPTTFPVKGKVTYDGTAISEGLIYFDNLDPKSYNYNAQIIDGDFTTAVVPGKYKIRFTATKNGPYPDGILGANGEKEGPQQFIPLKYNEKSELTEEISSAPRELQFTLKK